MRDKQTLVVIGGGAAGFFCAVNAARMQPSMQVILLEKSNKLLSKVKVSGGGRCNVTHACFDIAAMSRHYPRGTHFVKKAFHHFFTTDTIQWFEERGVRLKTEKDGRMFPVTDSSQTIIDCLLREAAKYQVSITLNREVTGIQEQEGRWLIQCRGEASLVADFICVATGGYPKSAMFEWLRATGHAVENPVPSLFTFNLPEGQSGKTGHAITALMGVSVEKVHLKIAGTKLEQEGPLLITHWGISGPAVLKLSAWAARELSEKQYHFNILISWLPDFNEQQLRDLFQQNRLTHASQKVVARNQVGLPARLWELLALQSGITPDMRWAALPAVVQNRFIRHLLYYECLVKGKTTFKDEFVTAGGIRLSDVEVNSMMSKKARGLFFAGEVLDVDGVTGGFNFQHAWTSGWIAAKGIAELAD